MCPGGATLALVPESSTVLPVMEQLVPVSECWSCAAPSARARPSGPALGPLDSPASAAGVLRFHCLALHPGAVQPSLPLII